VAGEERLAELLEVALVLGEQAVEPREQLLSAMVGVQDDGDAVDRGDAADEVGRGNATGNGGLLAVVADALAGKEGTATLGQLQDDGALLVPGSLERGDDGGRRSDVLGLLLVMAQASRCR
jgi:hypothetical protein